jgi:hypothetical protein
MRQKIITIIVLLALTCSATVYLQPAQAAANVTILTHSKEFNNTTKMHSIYGEIQNTGDMLVLSVKIEATYFDSSNNIIGTKDANASALYILPGQKCPFVIQLTQDDLDTEAVIAYSLKATWNESTIQRETGLDIASSSSNTVSDILHVTGSIKNTASSPASELWAIVTWYDSNGKVICTNKDTATPRALTSGQTATFDVSWLGSTSRQTSVASYSVMAYSLQYSSNSKTSVIPELPFMAVLAIMLFAGLAVTMTKKSFKKPISP